MLRRLLLVLAFCGFLLAVCACRTAPLVNPDPIVIRSQSAEVTRERIWNALQRRRWYVAADEPGEIVAKLSRPGYSATVRIEYDAESIRIDYVDSEGLDYRRTKKGKEFIHQNYMKWVQYLLRDINAKARVGHSQMPERSEASAGSGFLITRTVVAT